MGDFSYLLPLFNRIKPMIRDGSALSLREPELRSSLAREDQMLCGWRTSILVAGALSSGTTHVEVFRRMVMDLREVDPYVPWTLLRSTVEDYALATWLLGGVTRRQRLTRTLKTWMHDLWERGKYDEDSDWIPIAPAKTADERRTDLKKLAGSLGLAVDDVSGRWSVERVLRDAGSCIGEDPSLLVAHWRIGSGFAHGRFWPNLRAHEVVGATPIRGGALMQIAIDESKLKPMASICLELLEYSLRQYERRSVAS